MRPIFPRRKPTILFWQRSLRALASWQPERPSDRRRAIEPPAAAWTWVSPIAPMPRAFRKAAAFANLHRSHTSNRRAHIVGGLSLAAKAGSAKFASHRRRRLRRQPREFGAKAS